MRNNLKSQPKNFMFRDLRLKAELTQEQLSANLNMSSSTIRKWEKEGVAPAMTIDEWLTFCNLVNIKFTELPYYFSAVNKMTVNRI